MAGKQGNQTPNTPDVSESELRELKVDELRDRARQAGVSGASGMRKEDLVQAVAEAGGAGTRADPSQVENADLADADLADEDDDADLADEDDDEAQDVDEVVGEDGDEVEDVAGAGAGEPGDAGPDQGRKRTGEQTSKSLQYSQEVTSPEQSPERPGRSLVTTSHEVIRRWAEDRDAVPATVEGTEHGDRLGVLRFRFGPGGSGSGGSRSGGGRTGRDRAGDGDDRLQEVSWEEWFATFDERRLNFIYQEQRRDGSDSNFFRLESPDRQDA